MNRIWIGTKCKSYVKKKGATLFRRTLTGSIAFQINRSVVFWRGIVEKPLKELDFFFAWFLILKIGSSRFGSKSQ